MIPPMLPAGLAAFLIVAWASPSDAQSAGATTALVRVAPGAVEMASRDADGNLIIRAQRVPERLVIDGKLDENVYDQHLPASGFRQVEPRYNDAATEDTQLWVFYDDRAIYFALRCFDSQPDRWSTLDLRRDSPGFARGESVSVALDTFNDKRNGYTFGINPHGGISDSAITNERDSNRDWNTIWDMRTAVFDGGWTVEMAIPFKSLRYAQGEQIWGINVRRTVRWKNEVSYLNPVPLGGQSSAQFGLFRFSSAATLVGVAAPPESRLVEVKPYGISSVKTDLEADDPFTNDPSATVGVDAKVGVTRGLVADFTYNTDFAQVEDDEQQVNLTRFSLFFPEKREFFLEGQGIFAFGGVTQRRTANPGEIPIPFFSRRIGIDDDGHAVPIWGGGRMTGRAGQYSLGIVNIQTRKDAQSGQPATNFSVVRVRRDVLRRSTIGVMAINRSAYGRRLSASQTYGVDGVFSFFENVNLNTYAARTRTPGMDGDDASYRVQFEYNADRYGLVLEDMAIGRDFNPEVGYVRRSDVHRNAVEARFSPRPSGGGLVRKYNYSVGLDRYARLSEDLLETRVINGTFGIEFENSDELDVQFLDNVESPTESFEVFGDVEIPVGTYRFRALNASYRLGTQRAVSGELMYEFGGFYGGTKHTVALTRGRVEPISNLLVEPGISLNWVDIPQGQFVAKVVSGRFVYMFTPRTFVSALVQYNSNSNSMTVNARLRWEYRPGSDLFIVYSDGRNTLDRGFPGLENRALTVKVTRFFRM